MPPQLVVVGGPLRDRVFPLEEGRVHTVGRVAHADIRLDDRFVSRRHSQVHLEGGQVFIRDCGSFNGTWVNGRRLPEARLNYSGRSRLRREMRRRRRT